MKRLLFVLALLCSAAALAAPFPLTNTRYGEASAGSAVLTTNGRDAFVLWHSRTTINMTRIVAGEYRVGRPVFPSGSGADIVWTGQYFLAVAGSGPNIVGRVLDATGEPVGGVFTIAENGAMPRIAWNGRNALLVYERDSSSVVAMLLTGTGAAVGGSPTTLATNAEYDVASNGNGFAVITASQSLVRVTTITAGGTVARQSTVSTFTIDPSMARTVAITSDGTGYLGVWSTRALFDGIPVAADGTLGTPFQFGRLQDGEWVRSASVVWTGSEYAAAFVGGPVSENSSRLYVARAATHTIQSVKEGIRGGGAVSLAAVGGRTLMTWSDDSAASLLLGDLTDLDGSVPVTFAAAQQDLGAAVSSPTATLVTWTEIVGGTRSLHAGVRGADGSWVERRIGGDEHASIAATDGTNFLLVALERTGWRAVLVDAQAKVLSRSALVPLLDDYEYGVFSIASNGRDYAVAYGDGGKAVLVRVSRTGVVAPPQFFPVSDDVSRATVASNGDQFLFVWNDIRHCIWPGCWEIPRVLAVRLRPDFTPIDAQPMLLAEDDAYLFGSVWRNGNYEVFWTTGQGAVGQRVPASGPVDLGRRFQVPNTEDLYEKWRRVEATAQPGSWMAIWPRLSGQEETRYFDVEWRTFPKRIPTPFVRRNLFATPDGLLAWAGPETNEAAPHHGAQRIMLDIPDSGAPAPDAPRATLAYDGREMKIEWSAPPQPVGGYRVEYRIGDGSWNEFPRQYGANERSATWTSVTRGKSYAFRVRAVGENGPGAYSEPVRVSTALGRRRSVR